MKTKALDQIRLEGATFDFCITFGVFTPVAIIDKKYYSIILELWKKRTCNSENASTDPFAISEHTAIQHIFTDKQSKIRFFFTYNGIRKILLKIFSSPFNC